MLGTRIYLVLIILSNSVLNCWLDESVNANQDEIYAIEIVVAENFVALGGADLIIKYKLSANDNNTRTFPEQTIFPVEVSFLSIQLSLKEDDGKMSPVAQQNLTTLPSLEWNEINFECGFIVRSGVYNIRLLEAYKDSSNGGADGDSDYSYYYYVKRLNGVSLDNMRTNQVSITAVYPTIDFEVPHRLESYTPSVRISFGLTKSLCKPKLPLPSTVLILARVTLYPVVPANGSSADGFPNDHLISPSTLILDDPLQRLEKEGQVSVTVKCHLWARNTSYKVEIWEDGSSRKLIASSQPIKVEWSSKFGLNLPKKSIIPCRGSLRVYVSYPNCILPGRDKIRIYGFEALPVPSHLAPKRLSYISEKQILTNQRDGRVVTFSCSLFPQRFSKYCFQYVNTAEDESVSIVIEKCLPTFYSNEFSDGGWGPWSDWSECSALSNKCGTEGKRFRYRFCDSPSPTFGGNFCQGNSVEEAGCSLEETGQPECSSNKDLSVESSNDYIYSDPEDGNNDDYYHNTRRNSHIQNKKKIQNPVSSLFYKNFSSTFGCECGCILHDLVPGLNYSLLISLNSNHSTCEDEDEEEHHNLKWVLHAKENRDRIRFNIIEADVQCISVSFRDGNTTDSNLLQVISTSTSLTHNNNGLVVPPTEEPLSSTSPKNRKPMEKVGESMESLALLSFESTGGSLSIAASDELNNYRNCLSPSLTFFAVYQIIPVSKLETPESLLTEHDFEFWTILFLKLVLTLFILIAFCSMLSGCASKVYKYKRLKLYGAEDEYDEDVELGTAEGGELLPGNSSRSTSVTIMSFDYTYWKQIRLQRLKCFLLRPKKLNFLTSGTKSFPNTPVHGVKKRLQNAKQRSGIIANKTNKNEKLRVKSISLSDTNLECVRYKRLYETSLKERHDNQSGRRESLNVNEAHSTSSIPGGAIEMTLENKTETKKSYQRKSFSSSATVLAPVCRDPTSLQELKTEKQRKEHENLHRRRNEKWKNNERDRCLGVGTESPKRSFSRGSRRKCGAEDLRPESVVQQNTDSTSDLNSMNDFELDYYDYDILNAGNIPGSYLLEPSFVFWSDSTNSGYDPMQSSLSDPGNNDIELLNTSVSTSTGLFTPSSEAHGIGIKETSFDTLNFGELKFADDEDDTTTLSDASVAGDDYEQIKEEKLRRRLPAFSEDNYHLTKDID